MITELLILGGLCALRKNSIPHIGSIGRLFGERIKKGDLIRRFKRGQSGNVNDNDFVFSSGICFNQDGEATKDIREMINQSYANNQKHLRFSPQIPIESMSDFLLQMCGNDSDPAISDNQAYWRTITAIANGVKFIWEDDGIRRGIQSNLFGKKAPTEKRIYRAIISKKGYSPEHFAETLSLDVNYTNEVLEALRDAPSPQRAKQIIEEAYIYNIQDSIKTDKASRTYYEDFPF